MASLTQNSISQFRAGFVEKQASAEMPGRTEEEWRRINLRRLKLDDHSPASYDMAEPSVFDIDAYKIGIYGMNSPQVGELPAGVTVTSLSDSFGDNDVQTLIDKVSTKAEHLFDYQILGADFPGCVVRIKDGTALEKPIWIEQASDNGNFFGTVIILAGEHVDAKIIDSAVFPNAEKLGWLNDLHVLSVGASSNIHYYSYNEIGSDNYGYQKLFTYLAKAAQVKAVQITSGGFQVKQWHEHILTGEHANLKLLGCLAAGGREFNDFDARVTHLADNTESSILYKTGLTDRAFALFTGNLIIPKETKNVKAEQLNRNLLMSDGARCESIPKLEVEPENVQCAHGTSIGFLDEDRIFYLMARGLTRIQAEKLLLEAFFAEILDEVSVAEVEEQIYQKISEKLGLEPKNV